ncbi:MAG: hypothetical protein ACK4IK_03610 [Bacteroidia bacterium]
MIPNAAYAFVEVNKNNEAQIKYIGKTSRSLKARFAGYIYITDKGRSTNNYIHNNIKKALINGSKVEIYALLDSLELNWGKFNINLAAGIEDSLIDILEPIWNGGKSESYVNETSAEGKSNKDSNDNTVAIKLSDTYLNKGFLNFNTTISKLFGEHNTKLEIIHNNKVITETKIDRRSRGNEYLVRIYGGKKLVEFYRQNGYTLNSFLKIKVLSKDKIEIIK